MCMRWLLAAQVSLQSFSMAKRANPRSSSCIILGHHLVIWFGNNNLITRGHSCMPPKWYICCIFESTQFSLAEHSFQPWSPCIFDITSIATSSLETSWFKLITLSLLFSLLTSVLHGCSKILQHAYISHTPKTIQLSTLFHLCPPMASKDMSSHIMMTWSHLHIRLFFWYTATCLGPVLPPIVIERQYSTWNCQSQQRSYVKAYSLLSAILLIIYIPLASMRSLTTGTFIRFSCNAQKLMLTSLSNCNAPEALLAPLWALPWKKGITTHLPVSPVIGCE
jgi:hypothetical protein